MSISILCVEPVGEICVLLGKMLPQMDLAVHHVATIDEALKSLITEHPALIIIDNSFAAAEICAGIAAMKQETHESKLLMISAIDEEVEIAHSAGVHRFLSKPFTKATLTSTVVALLE